MQAQQQTEAEQLEAKTELEPARHAHIARREQCKRRRVVGHLRGQDHDDLHAGPSTSKCTCFERARVLPLLRIEIQEAAAFEYRGLHAEADALRRQEAELLADVATVVPPTYGQAHAVDTCREWAEFEMHGHHERELDRATVSDTQLEIQIIESQVAGIHAIGGQPNLQARFSFERDARAWNELELAIDSTTNETRARFTKHFAGRVGQHLGEVEHQLGVLELDERHQAVPAERETALDADDVETAFVCFADAPDGNCFGATNACGDFEDRIRIHGADESELTRVRIPEILSAARPAELAFELLLDRAALLGLQLDLELALAADVKQKSRGTVLRFEHQRRQQQRQLVFGRHIDQLELAAKFERHRTREQRLHLGRHVGRRIPSELETQLAGEIFCSFLQPQFVDAVFVAELAQQLAQHNEHRS